MHDSHLVAVSLPSTESAMLCVLTMILSTNSSLLLPYWTRRLILWTTLHFWLSFSTARSASCQTGRTRTISSVSALMVWSRVHAYIIILYSQRIRCIAHYALGYINLLTFIICYVTVQCSTGVSVLGGRRAASCLYHTLWPSGTVPDLRSWGRGFNSRPWLLWIPTPTQRAIPTD